MAHHLHARPRAIREFEQKLPAVAAVGDVPDVVWQEVTIGPGHRLFP